MKSYQQFSRILLLLMMSVCVVVATIVTNKFKKLEIGQNITGTIETETATSKLHCSNRYHEWNWTVVVIAVIENKAKKRSLYLKSTTAAI